MISVCMATKNGGAYLAQQLDSILPQLGPGDELIIADDESTDDTIAIIEAYSDAKIKLIKNAGGGSIARNFEVSLQSSKGDFIFLADQDDVWVPTKVKTMMDVLEHHDLVVSDCMVVDYDLTIKNRSFFSTRKSGRGLLKNIVRNSYMGCCMAFKRKLLRRALPFPDDIPAHDFWLGLIAEIYFDVKFIPEPLVYHRRHFSNASTTGEDSVNSLLQKIDDRYRIIKNLFFHKSYAE